MSRRVLAAGFGLCLLLSHAAAETMATPAAIVAKLYQQTLAALKTASPESAFFKPSVRAKYFTKGFDQLITTSEAKAQRDGDASLDFDPIISGQDAEIKNVTYTTDRMDADKAIVSAHFLNFGVKTVVAYDFVKAADGWRIDDVRGTADKQPWSIRQILSTPDK